MTTPVIYNGIPVAIRERQHSLKHSKIKGNSFAISSFKKSKTGIYSFIFITVWIYLEIKIILTWDCGSERCYLSTSTKFSEVQKRSECKRGESETMEKIVVQNDSSESLLEML